MDLYTYYMYYFIYILFIYLFIFRPESRLEVNTTRVGLNFADVMYNLANAPISRGVAYGVTLVAGNDNGMSKESNEVTFELGTCKRNWM